MGFGDSSLVQVDKDIVESAFLLVNEQYEIAFQFAPHVVREGNASRWKEKDVWGIEPLKIHTGSDGRKISVEWEYIATDSTFTGERIAKECRNLKSYFFEFKQDRYPVVEFVYTQILPDGPKYRLMNVDIAYGPELVKSGSEFYPLHTKVSIAIELATKINLGNQSPKVEEEPLPGQVNPKWY